MPLSNLSSPAKWAMIINAKKVNVLEGDWLTDDYYKFVKPRFIEKGIPVFRQEVLPLIRLYDDAYWGGLRSVHRIDLAVLDPHHWQFSDRIFAEYIERITSVHFPAICISDYPFGYDVPKVEIDDYARKLSQRTALLATAIKKRYADTVILSPAIGVVSEEYLDTCLDYHIDNRQHFTAYAVHCCNNSDEHTLGRLTSLLTQVLKVLPKELWITKWAIPCFEGKLVGSSVMGATSWEPINNRASGQRLRRTFTLLETLAKAQSKWFYVGAGKDAYHPRLTPSPDAYWSPLTTIWHPDAYKSTWDFYHFLGMLTHDGQIKDRLLESFISLATRNNA